MHGTVYQSGYLHLTDSWALHSDFGFTDCCKTQQGKQGSGAVPVLKGEKHSANAQHRQSREKTMRTWAVPVGHHILMKYAETCCIQFRVMLLWS
jgi:hypothetical protein